MVFSPWHHAVMFGLLAKGICDHFGEAADGLLLSAVEAYGQERGRRMAARCLRSGDPIDDMASLTYYSASHFMKFFKNYMGSSFIEYLNDYRLTMAEQMLRNTDDSVLEIAGKSGFDNLSYFNRIFKKKYGASPGKWRKAQTP